MKIWCLSIVLMAIFVACKPIAKQESLSEEQSLHTLHRLHNTFMKAISKGDINKARKTVANDDWSFVKVQNAVEESVAKGHSKEIHELIKNYNVGDTVELERNFYGQIEILRNTLLLDDFFSRLQFLKTDIRKTFNDFRKLEVMIKHSNLHSTSAEDYVKQLTRLQAEFDEFADPLLDEIDHIVKTFSVEKASEYEGMQIHKRLIDETSEMKELLKHKFFQ